MWCYQKFAEKVGKEKYREVLSTIDYGHLNDKFNLTTFWLDNGVTISALEQIEFLKGVYHRRFPFKASAYETLGRPEDAINTYERALALVDENDQRPQIELARSAVERLTTGAATE